MPVFTINYRTAPARTAPSGFERALAGLRQALAIHRTRNLLVQMDDRALSDIGMSRAQAGYPVHRPIWDAGLR